MEVTMILERPYLLAQDFRVEERFGFDSHLPRDGIRRHPEKTKGIEVVTSRANRNGAYLRRISLDHSNLCISTGLFAVRWNGPGASPAPRRYLRGPAGDSPEPPRSRPDARRTP